jgi:hypothetical protein
MTPNELPRNEAAKWLRQAARDRNAARVLIDVEPSRSVFLSQQAAEKAAKAFLTFHQIAFRKTHDLADLGTQCEGRRLAVNRPAQLSVSMIPSGVSWKLSRTSSVNRASAISPVPSENL